MITKISKSRNLNLIPSITKLMMRMMRIKMIIMAMRVMGIHLLYTNVYKKCKKL